MPVGSTKRAPPKKPPHRANAKVDRELKPPPRTVAQATKGNRVWAYGEPVKWGPPSKWNEDMHLHVFNLCLLGLTDAELARHLQIAESTFGDYVNPKHGSFQPTLVATLKDGREGADSLVAGALYARALGYSCDEQVAVNAGQGKVEVVTVRRQYPPDVAAAFIWLKNRKRKLWRDKHPEEPEDPTRVARVVQEAVEAALKTLGDAES